MARIITGGFILMLFTFSSFTQSIDSTSNIKLGGYIDTYYAYYSDSLGQDNYQKFAIASPKSNSFGINIAQLTGSYFSESLRAVMTIHFGDIPSGIWSPVYNIVQEANAGIRITPKLWVDAGLFKTHIGTESPFPKDNITSILSLITFNEPGLQTGVKFTYTPNDNLSLSLHLLDGYNTFTDNNKFKSVGLAVNYTIDEKGSLAYYNLIGDESITKGNHLRILHNIVFNYQISSRLRALIGIDYITQKNSVINDSTQTANVYSAILAFRYQLTKRFAIYTRFENFSDEDGFLTGTIEDERHNITGYKAIGATLGIEFKPRVNAFVRLETRYLELDRDQRIFHEEKALNNTYSRIEAMINMGIWF